jgi:hypothetical protein
MITTQMDWLLGRAYVLPPTNFSSPLLKNHTCDVSNRYFSSHFPCWAMCVSPLYISLNEQARKVSPNHQEPLLIAVLAISIIPFSILISIRTPPPNKHLDNAYLAPPQFAPHFPNTTIPMPTILFKLSTSE